MKKTIALIIVVVLIISVVAVYKYNSYKSELLKMKQLNDEYENFTQTEILGTSLITLINKAIDNNEKNNISVDDNGIYLNNDTNSMKIEVKFRESDETYPMERIGKLGSEQFMKNYGTASFKCTNKQYHEKTKNISYLLFEQI